jgi:uncharacterized damage-inducible protein DinB
MPTVNEVLSHSLTNSSRLLNRFCEDLKPEEYLHRPTDGANCVAWLIGHLVMTDRSALTRLAGPAADLPALPEGFEKRFARDAIAPGAESFGDVTILIPLLNQHRQRLIGLVRGLPAEVLERPLDKPHPMFSTVWEMLNFMSIHVSMHAGQISTIRRCLGRPPIM